MPLDTAPQFPTNKYLIQSKAFPTYSPIYALVDEEKAWAEVVCYAGQDPGNIGHWKATPEFPVSPFYHLQLADRTQRKAGGDPFFDKLPVSVGPLGTPWDIHPPLSEGDASTPRTISTGYNDTLHVSEWTIHGDPNDRTIPKSVVRIQIRTLKEPLDPKSLWYFIPVN